MQYIFPSSLTRILRLQAPSPPIGRLHFSWLLCTKILIHDKGQLLWRASFKWETWQLTTGLVLKYEAKYIHNYILSNQSYRINLHIQRDSLYVRLRNTGYCCWSYKHQPIRQHALTDAQFLIYRFLIFMI